MKYEQYKIDDNSAGRILYELELKGVPIEILEKLSFSKWGEITFEDRPFAFYDLSNGDVPSFRFTGEFRRFALS